MRVGIAGGLFATYKLALYVIAADRLGISPPHGEKVIERLLAMQTPDGGWITDYRDGRSGSPRWRRLASPCRRSRRSVKAGVNRHITAPWYSHAPQWIFGFLSRVVILLIDERAGISDQSAEQIGAKPFSAFEKQRTTAKAKRWLLRC